MPDLVKAGKWRFAAAALLTGLLGAVAFPPSSLHLLGLIAFVPLYWAAARGAHAIHALLAGIVYHGLTVSWIGLNSEPPALVAAASAAGAAVWLSVWWMLAYSLLKKFMRRFGIYAVLLHAPLVVVIDWLIEQSEMGFPWPYIGVTQAESQVLAPIVSIASMHALTLFTLLFSALVWLLLEGRRSWLLRLLPALWLLVVLGGGRLGTTGLAPAADSLSVVVIQANIGPEEKWSLPWQHTVDAHLELSREALLAGGPADLIIWPETAVPTRLRYRPGLVEQLSSFCAEHSTALLTGANDMDPVENERGRIPFNGSFLVTRDGIVDSYRKIRLVPFGERVPGQKLIPALGSVNLGQAEFGAGTDRTSAVLPLADGDTVRFGWSICFEGNFASLARDMVRDGAGLLTNQTNDAWFGTSRELDQHLAVGRLRTLETGRWLARATNNGYSGFVDERGRVRQLLSKGEAGWLRERVPVHTGKTFYTVFGDLLPRLSLLLISWPLLLLLVEKLSRLRRGTNK
jgi:apolipoprotein N-acyltransferase